MLITFDYVKSSSNPKIIDILLAANDFLLGGVFSLFLLDPPPFGVPSVTSFYLDYPVVTSFTNITSTLPLLIKYMNLPVSPYLTISSSGKKSNVYSLFTI